jgi:hypothetical protein
LLWNGHGEHIHRHVQRLERELLAGWVERQGDNCRRHGGRRGSQIS